MGSVIYDSLDYSMMVGQSCRVRECFNCAGMGNSLAVQITRKEDGFLWHCFRCNKTGFINDKGASPAQVQEIIENAGKEKKDTRPETVELPADTTKKIPAEGLVQMYDLMLEDEDIERHEIGWSPAHGRIIIPLFKYGKMDGGQWAKKLVGYLGRKLDSAADDKPKWFSVRQRDVQHPRFIAIPETIIHTKQVVLVEDIFSAIRVGNTGRICTALLTTYLPYEMYPVLIGWDVRIWLDADAYNKAVKYQAALGSNGVAAQTIYTDKDPKHYTETEIEEAIIYGRIKSRSN